MELSSALLKFVKSSRAQYLAYLEQQRFAKNVPNKGDALRTLGEQKSKLTKQLKCLNEDYDKYTADANKQSDLEAMKQFLARGITAKDNANKIETEIKTIDSEIAYLKKTVNIKIFLLYNRIFIRLCEIIFRSKLCFYLFKKDCV